MTSHPKPKPIWLPAGDQGLMLDFTGFRPVLQADVTGPIDEALSQHITSLADYVRKQDIKGLIDIVPSLTRLLFVFDSLIIAPSALRQMIEMQLDQVDSSQPLLGRHWCLPICYDGDYGPDIAEIAERTHLNRDEVIEAHLASQLHVSVMGFMPGLGYMSGADERLSLPRRANPRTAVPARSVGIAIGQCVIYPLTSPGGWHLIGRTSFPLFDTRRDEPILLRTGDTVSFTRIDAQTLTAQETAYEAGKFTAADILLHGSQR